MIDNFFFFFEDFQCLIDFFSSRDSLKFPLKFYFKFYVVDLFIVKNR